MGCGNSKNEYLEQNKQGIYPQQQIISEVELQWPEAVVSGGDKTQANEARDLIQTVVTNLLSLVGQSYEIDDATFNKYTAQYASGGMFAAKKPVAINKD